MSHIILEYFLMFFLFAAVAVLQLLEVIVLLIVRFAAELFD